MQRVLIWSVGSELELVFATVYTRSAIFYIWSSISTKRSVESLWSWGFSIRTGVREHFVHSCHWSSVLEEGFSCLWSIYLQSIIVLMSLQTVTCFLQALSHNICRVRNPTRSTGAIRPGWIKATGVKESTDRGIRCWLASEIFKVNITHSSLTHIATFPMGST